MVIKCSVLTGSICATSGFASSLSRPACVTVPLNAVVFVNLCLSVNSLALNAERTWSCLAAISVCKVLTEAGDDQLVIDLVSVGSARLTITFAEPVELIALRITGSSTKTVGAILQMTMACFMV